MSWSRIGLIGFALAAVATACSATPTERTVWDESAIVSHLGLATDSSGVGWTYEADGLSCEIAVVMTTPAQVALYADAGDVIATNPAGTAGVKVVGAETATCLNALTEALASLK